MSKNQRWRNYRRRRTAGWLFRAGLPPRGLGESRGELYKVTLAYSGEDPRLELREKREIGNAEFDEISRRLRWFDAASRSGERTRRLMAVIAEHPKAPAAELARMTGYEKQWFKTNVRKLKNLGLNSKTSLNSASST